MIQFLVDKTISVIGAGRLGTAVIDALYEKGHKKIIATRRNEEQLTILKQKYSGILTTSDNVVGAEQSDILVLGVKPGFIEEVGQEIQDYTANKLVISLAAGKSLDYVNNVFSNARVACVMTGIFVKDEVLGYSLSDNCLEEDEKAIKYIFGNDAIKLDEEQLPGRTWVAVDTGIIAQEIGTKIQALVSSGMKEEYAAKFYAGTLRALADAIGSGKTGEEIYLSVAGQKGFTQKMYQKMLEKGHFDLLKECVEETLKKLK